MVESTVVPVAAAALLAGSVGLVEMVVRVSTESLALKSTWLAAPVTVGLMTASVI